MDAHIVLFRYVKMTPEISEGLKRLFFKVMLKWFKILMMA